MLFTPILFLLLLPIITSLIQPTTNSGGQPDMTSITNHMLLMEKTITSLQSQVLTTNSQLATVQSKLQTTEDELKNVIAELRTAETDIEDLKTKVHTHPSSDELTDLKAQVNALETGQRAVVEEIILTVHGSLNSSVKSNTGEIQIIKSQLLETITRINRTSYDMNTTRDEYTTLQSKQHGFEQDLTGINATVQSTSSDMKVVESQISTLQSQQHGIEHDLTGTKATVQSTSTDMRVAKSQISTLQSKQQDIEHDLIETKATVQSTSTDMRVAKTQISSLQSKQHSYEQDLTGTKAAVQSTSSDMKVVKSQITTLSSDVTRVSQQLSAYLNKTGTPDIRFQVSLDKHSNTGFSTLKFDSVNVNVGGGYNEHSGIFTAPVSGTYSLWANIIFYSPVGEKSISIQLGDKVLASGATFVEQAYDFYFGLASATTVTHLNAGDKIHFVTDHPDSKIVTSNRSSYGGVLLHTS